MELCMLLDICEMAVLAEKNDSEMYEKYARSIPWSVEKSWKADEVGTQILWFIYDENNSKWTNVETD